MLVKGTAEVLWCVKRTTTAGTSWALLAGAGVALGGTMVYTQTSPDFPSGSRPKLSNLLKGVPFSGCAEDFDK